MKDAKKRPAKSRMGAFLEALSRPANHPQAVNKGQLSPQGTALAVDILRRAKLTQVEREAEQRAKAHRLAEQLRKTNPRLSDADIAKRVAERGYGKSETIRKRLQRKKKKLGH